MGSMVIYTWGGQTGQYTDPTQWTSSNVPLYGSDVLAAIEAGEAILTNAEPNGVTLTLGDSTLLLENAAFGPQMSVNSTGVATLGIDGYNTNYGQIVVGGTLIVDIGQYSALNQLGTLTVPTAATLMVDSTGDLNNIGLIKFAGGRGTITDNITGNGIIDLADAASSLELLGAAGPSETFALDQGTLRIDTFGSFAGTIADFSSTSASLTLGQITFNAATYMTEAAGASLSLTENGILAGVISLTDTPVTSYSVTQNLDGTRTITPINPGSRPSSVYDDGWIPSAIASGMVTILNAEPNGQTVLFGSQSAASQPELVLQNAALGPQLTLEVASSTLNAGGYGTVSVAGYDTNYGQIDVGILQSPPNSSIGHLTIDLTSYGQLNQEGVISLINGSSLLIQSVDPTLPGTLNNDGSIVVGGFAVINAAVVGIGSFTPRLLYNGGTPSLEIGFSFGPSQTINLGMGPSSVTLDDPSEFAGQFRNWVTDFNTVAFKGLQADTAQYQQTGTGTGQIVLSEAGSTVGVFALNGTVTPTLFVADYNSSTNTTTVSGH